MKKLLVVVIIAVIVALLLAYKCSRSRGAEDAVDTLPETSQPAPAEEPAPAPVPVKEAEPAPTAEEQKPVETSPETSKAEQKPVEQPAPAPAKEKKEAKPANTDAEKVEKPVEKPAPKAVEEKKPVEREEKSVPGRPTPALDRAPEGSNIDSAGVSKVINVSKAAIKRCYDKALTSNPMLKGKLSVKITINEQGRVSNTEVVDDSLHDAEVTKCVKGVIGRLRFPKPAGGSASVTFPFAFDPKNQ